MLTQFFQFNPVLPVNKRNIPGNHRQHDIAFMQDLIVLNIMQHGMRNNIWCTGQENGIAWHKLGAFPHRNTFNKQINRQGILFQPVQYQRTPVFPGHENRKQYRTNRELAPSHPKRFSRTLRPQRLNPVPRNGTANNATFQTGQRQKP